MIERKFVDEKIKEFQVQEFIAGMLSNAGHSRTKLVRTPLGEKIVIFASRPGLVVGKKGENIKKLTTTLKKKFKFENPQIEISEVTNPNLDARIVAERIASTLERFGIQRFKGVGHKTMSDVMSAGALGVEILISGKVPSSRAKSWRFYEGYLKKCGDIALKVSKAYTIAKLKTGVVGIKVSIMPPDIDLPDKIVIKTEDEIKAEAEEKKKAEEEKKEAKPKTIKKKRTRKPRKKKADDKKDAKADKKATVKTEIKEETKAEVKKEETPETKNADKTAETENTEKAAEPQEVKEEVKESEAKPEEKKEEITEEK